MLIEPEEIFDAQLASLHSHATACRHRGDADAAFDVDTQLATLASVDTEHAESHARACDAEKLVDALEWSQAEYAAAPAAPPPLAPALLPDRDPMIDILADESSTGPECDTGVKVSGARPQLGACPAEALGPEWSVPSRPAIVLSPNVDQPSRVMGLSRECQQDGNGYHAPSMMDCTQVPTSSAAKPCFLLPSSEGRECFVEDASSRSPHTTSPVLELALVGEGAGGPSVTTVPPDVPRYGSSLRASWAPPCPAALVSSCVPPLNNPAAHRLVSPALERADPRRLPGSLPGDGPHPRPWARSPGARDEYDSFEWPLTSLSEVQRLLRMRHIRPTWLMLGDASASWTSQLETSRGVVALVVDRRELLQPCLGYRGSFHEVLPLQSWDGICGWPSCTHQAVSNAGLLCYKERDGRMFFGLVGVLYVMFAGSARVRIVEQPVTTLSRYFEWPTHRLRTSAFGDTMDKTICLRLVGLTLQGLAAHHRDPVGPLQSRLPIWAFSDAEARDAYRSSWAHFPLFLIALAVCLVPEEQPPPPTFAEAVEALAVSWHRAKLPVPQGYGAADGLPPSEEAREYQLSHGKGHGVAIAGVVPHSLQVAGHNALVTVPPSSRAESTDILDDSLIHPGALRQLAEAHRVALAALTAQGFMIFFMSVLLQPLVYAPLSGLDVIGAELPLPLSPKRLALPIMEQWAEVAWGAGTAATTFLIGTYENGPRIGVATLPFVPAERDIVRDAGRLRRLRSTRAFAWCTLSALALLPIADPAARAFAGVQSFVKPVQWLADFAARGQDAPHFRIGARAAVPLDASPRLMLARTPVETLLALDASNALLLRHALEQRVLQADGHLYDGWAEVIRPHEADVHAELAGTLPDFSDEQLLQQPFSEQYVPPRTDFLPRAPAQPERDTPFCVRSPMQLLQPSGQRRLLDWLEKVIDQLLCIEAGEPNCELLRPHPIAIGQGALWPWARGIIWDLTFERAPCAVPLDFTLPIESGLDLEVLKRRLQHYPDQRLVSFLVEGVRFEADVELQTVLVPHLISLPKGFASVRKELYRLHQKDWYRFFDHLPFWPMYVNGQGAAARKLSERYRRTTECGGPRKPCRDETGLLALSINEASSLKHFPQWFHHRLGEAEWDAWLEAKGLLDPLLREVLSALPKEVKPTVADIMRDLSVLLAASRLLGEPIYIFGDDARDHFNQLAISSEDWNLLGVIFLHDLDTAPAVASPRERVFFVSERRLGFGAKVSSNIAQRFSEAALSLLREDMDALEAAQPPDPRPSMAQWRSERLRVAKRYRMARGQSISWADARLMQSRLYFAKMYTDDAVLAVVGVQRALRLLGCWQKLMASIRLEMAPPEKRTMGTWVPWLGVLICAGLGLVVVPKSKLLRTTQRIVELLAKPTEFSEYRSLMGMLEHIRCVNQAPRSVMYGLYTPHGSSAIRAEGPAAIVAVHPFMDAQLRRWLELLTFSGGAPVTAAISRVAVGNPLQVVVSSDAATDSSPPGIGGFCHGLYWYLQVKAEWLEWLHITVLELLATGGSALAFDAYTSSAEAVVLQSDALATPFVLTNHRTSSRNLAFAHHLLLADTRFKAMAGRANICHLFGDCNPFSDAVSRSLWPRFFSLCESMGIRPVQLKTPPGLTELIEQLVEHARIHGERVRVSSFVKPPPVLPPAMRGLGRRTPACEEADAVSISDRLWQRMNPGATPPLAASTAAVAARSSTRATYEPMPPPAISARLAKRMQLPAAVVMPAPPADPPVGTMPASRSGKARAMPQLSTEVIAGMRVLAVPESRARAPTQAKKRKADELKAAAHACASTRAASMAKAGFANTSYGLEQLTRLLQHAVDLNDFGAAVATQSINETAWQHWTAFAELLGFEPIFTVEQVRDHQSHIGTLLATFLLFVYPKMKGKGGRQWAKPRSAFAYVLAIIRIFREWKMILPPAKVVKGELHGLLRAFVRVHGVAALMPKRREPLTHAMITRMQSVSAARLGARSYTADSPIGKALRGILAVGWRTGHRLAEFVYHPSGDVCYLTRGCISYVIGGVLVADPTAAQLQQMQPGDVILIQPPRSKTDQFGEIHCPFPSTVPFRADPHSAGFILRQQELDDPCRGLARAEQPLFADADGRPFTHAVMDTLLNHMLTFCFGQGAAAKYSWHSMRVGLATALKAANVPDDVIQMICRWMNPESLRAYARHGQSLHVNCVDQAEHALIDTIQSANVPRVCSTEGNAALHLAYAPSISAQAQAVLDAMDAATVPPAPDASPLVESTCAGRRVLVPRAVYPTYECTENGGHGWSAVILSCSRGAATMHFTDAATARGLPYADVQLQLAALRPM